MTTFVKARPFARRSLAVRISMAAMVVFSMTMAGQAAAGSATFTTFNAHVDGAPSDVCLNSPINCNVYTAESYVWLNGGPTTNALLPDGTYFFAVLVPGGQSNPNDGGAGNLSDDIDCYQNRLFMVTNGEVSYYGGYAYCPGYQPYDKHWFDDGKSGDKPNWKPPYLRLWPYAQSTNSGGEYILAVCSLAGGYPVRPEDCSYDTFKIKRE